MELSVLASGSGGNAAWFSSGGDAVLVDCGLSVPELRRRLAAAGLAETALRAVFLTHDHGDHVGSSVALARRLGLPLYATRGTHSILRRLPPHLAREVTPGDRVAIDGLEVEAFATPHDGLEPVGYRVTEASSGRSAAVATDLGYVARKVVDRLQGVHALVVELNHDPRMLAEGPYPASLQRRIRGGLGHLTNDQGAELAGHVLHDGLGRIVLAHLSRTNNTPELALRAFERVSARAPHAAVHVADQERPSPVFTV